MNKVTGFHIQITKKEKGSWQMTIKYYYLLLKLTENFTLKQVNVHIKLKGERGGLDQEKLCIIYLFNKLKEVYFY